MNFHLIENYEPEIDSIVQFLNSHSDYLFEIGGYTTFLGSDEFNLRMSEAQAENFMNTLIENGAIESQLISKGYGEINPINSPEEIDKLESEEARRIAHGENGRIITKVIKKKIERTTTKPKLH